MSKLISIPELIELGVSGATIYRKTNETCEWEWTFGPSPGKKGLRRPKMIVVASLPADLQMKWAKLDTERRASAVGDSDAEEPQTSSPDSRLDALQSALARFSPPQYTLNQRQAVESRCLELARLCDEAIKLIGKLKRTTGISITSPGASEAGPGRAYHPALAALAARTASTDLIYTRMYPSASKPISTSTLLRLIKQYQKQGLVAFIRQTQTLSPAKDERFLEVPQEAIDWLRDALKSYVKASLTLYGERWLKYCKRKNIKLPFTDYRPGKPNTCYSWLYRWKKSVPAISMVLAEEGERGIETRYEWIKRDYADLRPREGFCMDWKTFDVECWLPAKKSNGKPMLTRLMVCTVFDLASKAVFGFFIDTRPSARGVTLAYLNAVGDADWKSEPGFEMLRGMQRAASGRDPFALWDNGRDFRAYAVEGREVQVKAFDLETGLIHVLQTYKVGLAPDLKFVVKHAIPFNAKAKPVEPFHHYLYGLWEPSMPGFKGIKTDDAPHYYKAARRMHEAFIKGVSPKSEDLRQLPQLWRETHEANKQEYGFGTPFLTETVFREEFKKCVIGYNRKAHGALTNDRGEMSPIEFLKLNADTPHMLSPISMAGLLMEPRPLTVRDGALNVQWGGERFIYREVASELSDGTALYRLPVSTTVEFRYDPSSVGRALVLAMGAPLCWVEQPQLLTWHATQADFEQANAKKKLARKTAREFYETQSQSTDWRDEAEARMPKALPVAVNAGEAFEDESHDDRGATVTVMTRFDRKSPDAHQTSHASEVSHLRVVTPQKDEDEFASLKSFASDDDDSSAIKAGWED
ncbi:MAG: hypothetical protein WBV94_06895 [Blastocatellia bacterium]